MDLSDIKGAGSEPASIPAADDGEPYQAAWVETVLRDAGQFVMALPGAMVDMVKRSWDDAAQLSRSVWSPLRAPAAMVLAAGSLVDQSVRGIVEGAKGVYALGEASAASSDPVTFGNFCFGLGALAAQFVPLLAPAKIKMSLPEISATTPEFALAGAGSGAGTVAGAGVTWGELSAAAATGLEAFTSVFSSAASSHWWDSGAEGGVPTMGGWQTIAGKENPNGKLCIAVRGESRIDLIPDNEAAGIGTGVVKAVHLDGKFIGRVAYAMEKGEVVVGDLAVTSGGREVSGAVVHYLQRLAEQSNRMLVFRNVRNAPKIVEMLQWEGFEGVVQLSDGSEIPLMFFHPEKGDVIPLIIIG